MLAIGTREASSYINGIWIKDDRQKFDIHSPYNGEVVGSYYASNEHDVEAAIATAYGARKEIAAIPVYKRATILKQASEILHARREEIATLISSELGKPFRNTLDEVARSVETLALSGEEAKRLIGETIRGDASERGENALAMTFRVPVGVVAAITPFNAPLNLVAHKVGPAFAAGNTVVLKPSTQTTLIAATLLEILLEAGLPMNAISLVIGNRERVGKIVSDDRVNVISFTGGTVASRTICEQAGMKKVLLELGGNAATIVHEDADIQRAATMCAQNGFSNSGQSCISVQRIYVHENIIHEFKEELVLEVSKLKIGDPRLPDTDIGTLVDEKNAIRIENWINEAVEEGAELLYGGRRNGANVTPAVLFNPKKQSKVVCEEVFGPIVSIIPFTSLEEVILEANDTNFGLQAGVFSNSIDLAIQVAQQLDVGGVVINGTSNYRLDHWPYGGVKDSGIGREGPRFAIEDMTEMKMVVIRS